MIGRTDQIFDQDSPLRRSHATLHLVNSKRESRRWEPIVAFCPNNLVTLKTLEAEKRVLCICKIKVFLERAKYYIECVKGR